MEDQSISYTMFFEISDDDHKECNRGVLWSTHWVCVWVWGWVCVCVCGGGGLRAMRPACCSPLGSVMGNLGDSRGGIQHSCVPSCAEKIG